jgi:hypothetical protein
VLQAKRTKLGQRFAYVDTILHGGSMLELIEADARMRRAFAFMQDAARTWDDTDPIR